MDYLSLLNRIVAQAENEGDQLHAQAAELRMMAQSDAAVNRKMLERMAKHLTAAAEFVDLRALRMIALYDPTAADFLRRGAKRDPRRELLSSIQHRARGGAPKGKKIR